MSHSCHIDHDPPDDAGYRRILIFAMIINFGMFGVEVAIGFLSNSVSLLADSNDFAGDGFNYLISLYVLKKGLKLRARASIFKALCMFVFALVVLASIAYNLMHGKLPHAEAMGVTAIAALVANSLVAILLFRHRAGDSNRLSVWLCSRNDAIGNVAVFGASVLVYFTHSNLPDLAVALVMCLLGLVASLKIYKAAKTELNNS